MWHGNAVGADAARSLLATEHAAKPDWSAFIGSFCVLSGDRNSQRLFLDPLGVYKVYSDQARRVFASSFSPLRAHSSH